MPNPNVEILKRTLAQRLRTPEAAGVAHDVEKLALEIIRDEIKALTPDFIDPFVDMAFAKLQPIIQAEIDKVIASAVQAQVQTAIDRAAEQLAGRLRALTPAQPL